MIVNFKHSSTISTKVLSQFKRNLVKVHEPTLGPSPNVHILEYLYFYTYPSLIPLIIVSHSKIVPTRTFHSYTTIPIILKYEYVKTCNHHLSLSNIDIEHMIDYYCGL